MIGKARQPEPPRIEETYDAEVGKARGVLRKAPAAGQFRHSRRAASLELAAWVDHYWMVSWDLRGYEPYMQQTLPHPNVHVVFEGRSLQVSGVFTGKFTRILEGKSRAFGIKFIAGGFRPFLGSPVSSLRNRIVPAERIFGSDAMKLNAVFASSTSEDAMVDAANAFLRERLPQTDKTAKIVSEIVQQTEDDREIMTVDDLCDRTAMGKRSLQRVFNEYVGVSPKWVIRRYRLHELVERCKSGEKLEWTKIALDLGYFDQAHMINDFRSIVGFSPAQYQKLVAAESPSQRQARN